MFPEAEVIVREEFHVRQGRQSRDGLLFVLEGAFTCRLGDRQDTVEAGSIYALHQDELFQRQVLRPLRCIYVRFDRFPVPLPSGSLKFRDQMRCRSTTEYLTRAVEAGDREWTEHLLRDILLLYRRQCDTPADEIVADCTQWLSVHCGEPITLDLLAGRYGLSRQGLIGKFRRYTGTTPMQYLTALRMDRSRQLLRNTTLPVGEIALRCGFENVYYFSRAFKTATGASPTTYRAAAAL